MLSRRQVQELKPSIQKGCGGSFEIATSARWQAHLRHVIQFPDFLAGENQQSANPPPHTHTHSRSHTPQVTYLLPKSSVASDDTHRVHLNDQQGAAEQEGRERLAVLHHQAQRRHLSWFGLQLQDTVTD